MIKEFKLDNKNIQIHYKDTELKELPVVVLNTFGNEGEAVYNKCIEIKCKEFILVSISNLDWNNDMTPWYAPKLNKNDADCLGKADDYLKVLVNNIKKDEIMIKKENITKQEKKEENNENSENKENSKNTENNVKEGIVFSNKNQICLVEIRNKLTVGDKMEILIPNQIETVPFQIEKLWDTETGEEIPTINPGKAGQTVLMPLPIQAEKGWILRRGK